MCKEFTFGAAFAMSIEQDKGPPINKIKIVRMRAKIVLSAKVDYPVRSSFTTDLPGDFYGV
ncbi:hypothetical protein GCM10027423_30040 [Spirosoma arcticum]